MIAIAHRFSDRVQLGVLCQGSHRHCGDSWRLGGGGPNTPQQLWLSAWSWPRHPLRLAALAGTGIMWAMAMPLPLLGWLLMSNVMGVSTGLAHGVLRVVSAAS